MNTRKKEVGVISFDSELIRMPDITETYISKDRRRSVHMKTTSNEMRIFAHYFTLLVGQYIPLNEPVWEYAYLLVQLIDLCLKSSFSTEDIDKLRKTVTAHHTKYVELFKKDLTPKHHFLLHYGSVIQSSGPVHKMMCFRNEAKHKGFKQYAHIMTSRKNICFTLCVKAYLQFTNDLLNNTFFTFCESSHFSVSDIRLRNYFSKLVQPLNKNISYIALLSSSITYKNTNYKTGYFVSELCYNTVSLYEIIEILKLQTEYYLIVQEYRVADFHEHYQAYECVGSIEKVDIISIEFFTRPPFTIHIIDRNIKDELNGRKMLFRLKPSFTG